MGRNVSKGMTFRRPHGSGAGQRTAWRESAKLFVLRENAMQESTERRSQRLRDGRSCFRGNHFGACREKRPPTWRTGGQKRIVAG